MTNTELHRRFMDKYAALFVKAYDHAPKSEHNYIAALALSWVHQLSQEILREPEREMPKSVELMVDRIEGGGWEHPKISTGALIEWVDAYPAAIWDALNGY